MPICQVCHKDNPEGAEYCEDCGTQLPTAGAASAVPVPVASTSAASGSPSEPAAPLMPDAPVAPTPAEAAPEAASPSPATTSPESAPPAESIGETAPTEAPQPPAPESQAAPTLSTSGAAPAGTGERPRLVSMRYGALTGEEIPLLGQRLIVGRFDPETGPVDIDLSSAPESGHISRQHGELYREADGSWAVRDLGSTNGIFVKGSGDPSFGPRITAPRPLSNGDELAFGNARFIFRID